MSPSLQSTQGYHALLAVSEEPLRRLLRCLFERGELFQESAVPFEETLEPLGVTLIGTVHIVPTEFDLDLGGGDATSVTVEFSAECIAQYRVQGIPLELEQDFRTDVAIVVGLEVGDTTIRPGFQAVEAEDIEVVVTTPKAGDEEIEEQMALVLRSQVLVMVQSFDSSVTTVSLPPSPKTLYTSGRVVSTALDASTASRDELLLGFHAGAAAPGTLPAARILGADAGIELRLSNETFSTYLDAVLEKLFVRFSFTVGEPDEELERGLESTLDASDLLTELKLLHLPLRKDVKVRVRVPGTPQEWSFETDGNGTAQWKVPQGVNIPAGSTLELSGEYRKFGKDRLTHLALEPEVGFVALTGTVRTEVGCYNNVKVDLSAEIFYEIDDADGKFVVEVRDVDLDLPGYADAYVGFIKVFLDIFTLGLKSGLVGEKQDKKIKKTQDGILQGAIQLEDLVETAEDDDAQLFWNELTINPDSLRLEGTLETGCKRARLKGSDYRPVGRRGGDYDPLSIELDWDTDAEGRTMRQFIRVDAVQGQLRLERPVRPSDPADPNSPLEDVYGTGATSAMVEIQGRFDEAGPEAFEDLVFPMNSHVQSIPTPIEAYLDASTFPLAFHVRTAFGRYAKVRFAYTRNFKPALTWVAYEVPQLSGQISGDFALDGGARSWSGDFVLELEGLYTAHGLSVAWSNKGLGTLEVDPNDPLRVRVRYDMDANPTPIGMFSVPLEATATDLSGRSLTVTRDLIGWDPEHEGPPSPGDTLDAFADAFLKPVGHLGKPVTPGDLLGGKPPKAGPDPSPLTTPVHLGALDAQRIFDLGRAVERSRVGLGDFGVGEGGPSGDPRP